MLVYLDTKDLINVLERSDPVSPSALGGSLRKAKAQLALSFITVAEISAPLLAQSAQTNVMSLLNRLETLPHVFLADSHVERLELEEAVEAFVSERKYSPIDPFVARFDYTIPLRGEPATAAYLRYSIAETIWDLWRNEPALFDGYATHYGAYQAVLTQDRSLANPPTLRANFRSAIQRAVDLHGVKAPGVDIQKLGDWIYSSPSRCPAKRLGYEVWHRIRSNVTDRPKPSDISDFNHLFALPYVDVATLDRRMLGYVTGATSEWSEGIVAACFRDAAEVLVHLESRSQET